MFALLDVPQSLWKSQNCNAANIGLNSQNARAMIKVIRPVCLVLLQPMLALLLRWCTGLVVRLLIQQKLHRPFRLQSR